MRPLIAVWPEGLAAYATLVWAFRPEVRIVRRARAADARSAGARDPSLRAILLAGYAGLVGGLLAAFFLPGLTIAPAHRHAVYWGGLAVLVLGSLLRRHCWRMLGESFTGQVQVLPDQQVVERGAYRWVRHPSYAAGLLMQLGIGLALGNWASVALLVGFAALAYGYRITLEERALVDTLGTTYEAYRARTRRLVPFVW